MMKSTSKTFVSNEYKANAVPYNKGRSSNVGLLNTHKATTDNTVIIPSERVIIQKFNNLIQETPEYLRHEIERLKLEILPLTKQYK